MLHERIKPPDRIRNPISLVAHQKVSVHLSSLSLRLHYPFRDSEKVKSRRIPTQPQSYALDFGAWGRSHQQASSTRLYEDIACYNAFVLLAPCLLVYLRNRLYSVIPNMFNY